MPLQLVSYSGKIKTTIDKYNALSNNEKTGEYWNNTSDTNLKEAKKHIKDHYIKYQDFTCCYCQQRVEIKHNAVWDIEHIIPKDQYPQFLFEPENLCVSCKDCNMEKSNKRVLKNVNRKTFPKKDTDYIIVHPHFDEYKKHIRVLKSSLFFIPKDTKGRKTIETCGLLRFLYKFSDYGNVTLEIKKKIAHLTDELLATTDPQVEHLILSAMRELTKRGKEISLQKALSSIAS
jgi:uncharacterized protein (TIGR02646 family)